MPLSPKIYSTCVAVRERLTNLQNSNTSPTRDNCDNVDLLFFLEFIISALECENDLEFIDQLLDVVRNFQTEERMISSLPVINAIRYFIEELKTDSNGSIIAKNLNQIINQEAKTSKVHLDPHVKQYIEKCRIIINSYLNGLDIQPDGLETTVKKYTSSFFHFFSASNKIVKSVDNPKVLLAKYLDADLALLLTDGKYVLHDEQKRVQFYELSSKVNKKSILHIVENIFANRMLQTNIETDNNNFFNILKLIKNDIDSELSTDTTLKHACPAITEQISEALTRQLQMHKKTVRRFEPAHVAHSDNIAQVIQGAISGQQTLGGEDERIVITSIRQNINNALHQTYINKKQEFNKHKNTPCSTLEPLVIESELATLDPNINEMLLLHGTSVKASVNIFATGFRKPADDSYLSIAGPLGTGVYMSDQLVKSGTFSTCVLCGLVTCSCKIAPEQKVEHCLIICKAILGNMHPTIEKRGHIPPHCDSVVGIGKHKNPDSAFNSNEICIADPAQILPLFEVKYFTYKNMLILDKWPAASEELKYLRIAIGQNDIPRVKKECEYLLAKKLLMPIIRKKLSDLLDQLHIEADQQAKEIAHSNNNNYKSAFI